MTGPGSVDEKTMRRIVREEAHTAANEAVENFLHSKVLMLGNALAGLMRGGQMVCSFCGSPQSRVSKMVAGSNGVLMCDRCIAAAHKHVQASSAQ